MNISERTSAIRLGTPDVLKSCLEEQNWLCDLCGHQIQDIIVAALDHSTPVIQFAQGSLPIEEAIKQANVSSNLRATHRTCNHAKSNKTREEWFTAGKNIRNAPSILTATELSEAQFRFGAGGRVGGRKNADNGQLASIRTQESITKGGRRAAELGVGVHTPEMRSIAGCKGGRIAGRKNGRHNVESGHLARISSLGGNAHVQSGHLASLRTPEHQAKASRASTHKRWHVARGIIRSGCILCDKAA